MLDYGYLHLRGRSKELIKSGGEQVFPAEVERVVAGHPDVVDVAVYGVPDDMWGERVECAVVLIDAATVSVDDLHQHCRSRMAAFKVPKRIVVVDALPYTSNLKLDRRALVRKASDA
jgi:fatty-acyl-CoA synthase